jgi:hypothetical protein
VPVLLGERRECRDGTIELGDEVVDHRAQFEDERGIDDVLAGGAPMDITGGLGILLRHFGGQCLYERDREIAGGDGREAERADIVELRVAGLGNRLGGTLGDHTDRGLGRGQCGFRPQHTVEPRAVGHDLAHRSAGEQWTHQRGRQQWRGH